MLMTYLMFVPNIIDQQLFTFIGDNDWKRERIEDDIVAEDNRCYSKSCYMFEIYLIRSGTMPP